MREHGLRPDREAQAREIAYIADAGIDHEAAAATRHRTCREEISEIAIDAGAGRREDEDVALLQLFDRDMDHPVVARRSGYGYRASGDARAGIDRAHVVGQQADTTLRLVDRRHARRPQPIDDRRVGPPDILHYDAHVRSPLHRPCAPVRDTRQSNLWTGNKFLLYLRSCRNHSISICGTCARWPT